ncbi:AMP-dependent synthetase/ligase [Albibacterium bauzanense]|uniref:Long-chain acyl-CoA synthetase n=1 Tax=Albibacterium bauzanense TaxID=653929 RepID=A0A4V2PY92_9SPHI|nr:long-chain fatty acid--CoA ligase [Albibacterium bauzanense]TCK85101.1 long-chain acyl-CoA synthetase [Albibacterium bauzanense]
MNPVTQEMTVPDLLRNVIKNIHPEDHSFLLEKTGQEWTEISYKTAYEYINAVSAYLISIGIQKGDRVALLIENSPTYLYFDQGIQQIGAINVSIYPTLPENDTEYILNDSGAKIILVGNHFLLKKIVKIANNCGSLTRIIAAFDDYEKTIKDAHLKAGVISFSSLINEGKKIFPDYERKIIAACEGIIPSDLSTLIYTSGTTGIPKGVMLTHSNLVNNVRAALDLIPVIESTDLFLSFLPLSHVFERTATYHICLSCGCRIAFAQSLELLAKNMEEVKPTVLNCVPRLLERIHDKAIQGGTQAGGMKAKIFTWALAVGKEFREVQENGTQAGPILLLKHSLAERLVFSKIKAKTGGQLKFLISGGGALSQNVGEFFGDLGIKILEGYGLTETSPIVSVTEYDRQVYGTVGRVVPRIEIGIQNYETNEIYTVQSYESFNPSFECPEGEIIIRGHCVMKGYWNKPEETANVIDKEGWLHTGDIGRFYKGNLQITDRLKNMLVNSFGKNIYPTPVENTYLKSPKIEQIFLIGDKQEYITAIIIPSQESLITRFNIKKEFFEKPDRFITDSDIISWLNEDIAKLSNELAKFERIKKFLVKRNPFSIDEGELTPTMKAKRKVIEKKYAKEIDDLYKSD